MTASQGPPSNPRSYWEKYGTVGGLGTGARGRRAKNASLNFAHRRPPAETCRRQRDSRATGKIMLGRARSRGTSFSHVHSPSPMSSLSREQHAVRRPGRSRSHGRPSAGIIGFRRGCVRGLARRTPAVEVALVVLLVVVAARLVVVDKHPRRRVAPQPAPQRRPPATTSCFPEVHVGAVWAVPRACRAGLCRPCGSPGRTNPRPPPGCASVPHSSSRHPRPPHPAGRQRHAFNRRRWSTKSTSVSRAISRRGVAAPASGVPGGGLFFAVPSFASRRF